AHIPYDGTPIPGVKYTIREYKSKKGGSYFDVEYTDFILEGQTDANGLVDIEFYRKKNQKYNYDIKFDYSSMNVSFPAYSLINAPTYKNLSKSNPDGNRFDIRVLPHCQMHFKIENVNCFNSSDSMRFKTYNPDERPFQSFDLIPVWSNYKIGCGIFAELINDKMLSGRKLYQIEVTRNGIKNVYVDTFFLHPNQLNEVFLQY
ncbi:MAG: hypothetical protein MUC48_19115, partial [Leptolyngbya sp. Prado105]|nr:hypothetical protein [Leptolyngbya sp. Prado105]